MAENIMKTIGGQSIAEGERAAKVIRRYRELQDKRDKVFRYFNDLTLKQYVDASVKRMILYQEQPSNDEDWQAKTVMGTTRNKTLAILSHVLGQRINVEFEDSTTNDPARPKIWKATWEASLDREDMAGRDVDFNISFSAAEKGTAIAYEGYTSRYETRKRVTSFDPKTNETTWNEEEVCTWDDCESILIDLLDFFPGDLTMQNIQDMPDCAWRSYLNLDQFKRDFAGFRNVDKVKAGGDVDTIQYFKEFMIDEIGTDKVMVIRYFNKVEDRFDIVANGIILTPLDNPLPWNHKLNGKGLPFWVMRAEPLDEHFFYGMSWPFKLKGQQDVLDVAYRMIINSVLLGLNMPVITDDPEFPEENFLYPGQVRYVETGKTATPMVMRDVAEGAWRLLATAQRDMDESSVSDVSSGQLSSSRKTATEIMESQKEAKKMIFLFQRNIETAMGDKAALRLENIKQFYGLPIKYEGKVEYRKLRVKNMPLMSGGIGMMELIFVGSKANLPPTRFQVPPEMIDEMFGDGASEVSVVKEEATGVEKVYLTPKALQGGSLGIKVIPNSTVKMNEALKIALFDEFEVGALKGYGDLIDRRRLFRRKAMLRGENPEEFLLEPQSNKAVPGMPPGMSGSEAGMGELGQQLTEGFGGERKSQETNLTSMISNA